MIMLKPGDCVLRLCVEKGSKQEFIVDIASCRDHSLGAKEVEVKKFGSPKSIGVITMVVGALGSWSKKIGEHME